MSNARAGQPIREAAPVGLAAAAPRGRSRIPLNTLGISFGLAGLAGTWTAASSTIGAPAPIGIALWILAAILWLATLVRYATRARLRDVGADLRHPVLGPFASLAPISGSLFGARLGQELPAVGETIVWAMLVLSVAFGGWFTAQLLTVPRPAESIHGGYFLPTVAASLISGQSLGALGHTTLATVLVAAGVLFWLLLGGMLLSRFATGPQLPSPLLPTLAIFSAPPAVAGNAWWTIAGAHESAVHLALLGTMAALLLPHLFLLRAYFRLPFALGFWALTFTTAASATYGVRLLTLAGGPVSIGLGWVCVSVATVIIGAIGVRSIMLVVLRAQPER